MQQHSHAMRLISLFCSIWKNSPFFGNRNNRKVRNLGESGICLVAEEIVRTCKKLVLRIGIFHVGVIHNFGV